MTERTELPYRSVHDGRAHKCGHDGHTAILLGVSAILAKRRQQFAGNVRLLFQPAEEGVRGGGARVMVAEGALEDVDEVYGLHNWPGYRLGDVHVRAGPMLANTHTFDIRISGIGGHGSQPQLCRDPIVAGAHLIGALQTVVSRGLGYEGGAVVTVGRFVAGTADNIIPEHAELSGTVRTFASEVTERVFERIAEIVAGIETMFGVRVALEVEPGYPVVVNDPTCARAVARVAAEVPGIECVREDGLPMAGGEDFAYMAQATRGAYFFLGAGICGAATPGCHHPDFDFDDRLLPWGMAMFVGLVDDRLSDLAARNRPG
jgi:amidohydrolase